MGTLLVALQFALIVAVAVPAWSIFMAGQAGIGPWGLLAAGTALGLWSLASNRPGNFNIRPTPRDGGRLVQSGPYRWIRHPMYSAVLLAAAACAWAAASVWVGLAWALLAGVLAFKAVLEEGWMARQHPGYAPYCQRTRRFVPGLL